MNQPLRKQTGQALVEWLVAFPVLMTLLGGALQFALVFSAKSTVDWATFEGVREATLNHGDPAALRAGLAKGLMPLFPNGTGASGYAAALAKATVAANNPLTTQVVMINPIASVAKAWTTTVNKQGQSVQEIPNSRLIFTTLAPRAGETLQAANLLKERVRYCAPLVVPFVNTVIKTMMTGPFAPSSAWELHCYASGGMPIAAVATELMQSALDPSYVPSGAAPTPPPPPPTGGGGGGGTGGGGGGAGGGTPTGGGGGPGGGGGTSGGGDGTPDACPIPGFTPVTPTPATTPTAANPAPSPGGST